MPQKRCNDVGNKISKMLDNGRIEIFPNDLEQISKGSLIAYLNNDWTLKPGGFLLEVNDDSFIYLAPNFKKKYRVYLKNVQALYIGDVLKTKNDLISIIETTQEPTNYPVIIEGIIIYYAVDQKIWGVF